MLEVRQANACTVGDGCAGCHRHAPADDFSVSDADSGRPPDRRPSSVPSSSADRVAPVVGSDRHSSPRRDRYCRIPKR